MTLTRRRVVGMVAAGTGLLVAVVVGVGFALPVEHVASGERVLPASPETVFARIEDVARYPEWRGGVTRVEVLGSDPLRWREHADGDALTFEVVERDAPVRLRVRIADPDLPFGGTWTYELRPEGPGTRLRITEHGEVYNPVFRFVSRFVFGHAATIEQFLDDVERAGRT